MTREEAKTIILKHQFAFAAMPDDIIKAINYLIKEEPGWIPVSERLPEDYEEVIASVDHEYVYPEARYSKEFGWEWAYEYGADYWTDLKGVDAWMPLPKAYKPESEVEMEIDDANTRKKQKILDLLAKESPMVLSTAYIYATSFVKYGADVTKAWDTAVEQTAILERVRQQAQYEAYDSFKKDYEKQLKNDLVAILTEIELEIDELDSRVGYDGNGMPTFSTDYIRKKKVNELIRQKTDALKLESEEEE